MKTNNQEIYINMDDSGVLHPNEKCCVYGGIIFTSKYSQDNFIRKYKKILNSIKCKYCHSDISKCSHICPEIKDTNIQAQHKRWIWNLIKKEKCFAVIINNTKINPSIMDNKISRRKFRDYSQRIIIKKIIERLVKDSDINPNLPLKLIIRIDQQANTPDENKKFIDTLSKELTECNLESNNKIITKPILSSKLNIDLKYVLSHKHVSIQASDFIAGETRRIFLSNYDESIMNKKLSYLDIKLFMPV